VARSEVRGGDTGYDLGRRCIRKLNGSVVLLCLPERPVRIYFKFVPV
jgi:hypothetical protein